MADITLLENLYAYNNQQTGRSTPVKETEVTNEDIGENNPKQNQTRGPKPNFGNTDKASYISKPDLRDFTDATTGANDLTAKNNRVSWHMDPSGEKTMLGDKLKPTVIDFSYPSGDKLPQPFSFSVAQGENGAKPNGLLINAPYVDNKPGEVPGKTSEFFVSEKAAKAGLVLRSEGNFSGAKIFTDEVMTALEKDPKAFQTPMTAEQMVNKLQEQIDFKNNPGQSADFVLRHIAEKDADGNPLIKDEAIGALQEKIAKDLGIQGDPNDINLTANRLAKSPLFNTALRDDGSSIVITNDTATKIKLEDGKFVKKDFTQDEISKLQKAHPGIKIDSSSANTGEANTEEKANAQIKELLKEHPELEIAHGVYYNETGTFAILSDPKNFLKDDERGGFKAYFGKPGEKMKFTGEPFVGRNDVMGHTGKGVTFDSEPDRGGANKLNGLPFQKFEKN